MKKCTTCLDCNAGKNALNNTANDDAKSQIVKDKNSNGICIINMGRRNKNRPLYQYSVVRNESLDVDGQTVIIEKRVDSETGVSVYDFSRIYSLFSDMAQASMVRSLLLRKK